MRIRHDLSLAFELLRHTQVVCEIGYMDAVKLILGKDNHNYVTILPKKNIHLPR